jgi:hypothetical protein
MEWATGFPMMAHSWVDGEILLIDFMGSSLLWHALGRVIDLFGTTAHSTRSFELREI